MESGILNYLISNPYILSTKENLLNSNQHYHTTELLAHNKSKSIYHVAKRILCALVLKPITKSQWKLKT